MGQLQFCCKMAEQFCLKWNDFHQNIASTFGSLRQDHDFSDITLACEDGEQVEAHKVILAASSPFFQNLLRRNNNPHPLIYMRGMKSEDIVSVVDFIYNGEANILEENLEKFLSLGQELGLKGLATGENKEGTSENEEAIGKKEQIKKKKLENKQALAEKYAKDEKKELLENQSLPPIDDSVEKQQVLEETVPEQNYEVANISSDFAALDDQVNAMMVKSSNMIANGNGRKTFALTCTACGKEGNRSNIRDHIEANHVEGVSIPCNFCDKVSRSRGGLRQHIANNHKQKLGYEQAVAEVEKKEVLEDKVLTDLHDAVFKQGVLEETGSEQSYEAENVSSDFAALDDSINAMMVKSSNLIPNGQRKAFALTCTACGKEGTRSNIREHIEATHMEGVSIPCTPCDKVCKSRGGLRQHIKTHTKQLLAM